MGGGGGLRNYTKHKYSNIAEKGSKLKIYLKSEAPNLLKRIFEGTQKRDERTFSRTE